MEHTLYNAISNQGTRLYAMKPLIRETSNSGYLYTVKPLIRGHLFKVKHIFRENIYIMKPLTGICLFRYTKQTGSYMTGYPFSECHVHFKMKID